MKYPVIKLEIEEDFMAYEPGGEPWRPMFCVTAQRLRPYYDDSNYRCFERSDPETLRAETIDELYELMAKERVEHTLRGEGDSRTGYGRQVSADDYTVEFSNLFIEVENYDEARLKNTTCYQNIGAARDERRAREKAEAERQKKLWAEAEAKRIEQHERDEFVRLSKKFKL